MSRDDSKRFEQLVQGYFDQTLDEEALSELTRLLREDDRRMRRFAELAQLQQMIASEVGYHKQAKRFNLSLSSSDTGAASAMAELARLYEDEPQLPVDFSTWRWQQAREARAKRRRVLQRRLFVGGASVAALLALAVALMVVLMGPAESVPPVAQSSNEPGERGPEVLPVSAVVAQLTAEHDASWAEGALSPGQKLRAGQRLTLTGGYAEITTNQGALVVLKAPATIELIDNPNALRLYAGKLVGICETESSKGFVVHTAHMDVVDISTRFGVEMDEAGFAEVHVLEGQVQAHPTNGRFQRPTLLSAGQSVRASSTAFEPIASDAKRFAGIRAVLGEEQDLANKTVIETDRQGKQWVIGMSEHTGSVQYLGNEVACTVERVGLIRNVAQRNAYGFVQYQSERLIQRDNKVRAEGTWTFTNLPAGQYDVATAFEPNKVGGQARYTVNGIEVIVDQSVVPQADAGPTIPAYSIYEVERDIFFQHIARSVTVPEGGSITVTIDNSITAEGKGIRMDSIAITRLARPQVIQTEPLQEREDTD